MPVCEKNQLDLHNKAGWVVSKQGQLQSHFHLYNALFENIMVFFKMAFMTLYNVDHHPLPCSLRLLRIQEKNSYQEKPPSFMDAALSALG